MFGASHLTDLSHYQANFARQRERPVKRTYQPSKLVRKRRHGFRARLATTGGRKVLRRPPRARAQASERLNRASLRDLIMDRLRQRADFLAVANGPRMNSAAFVVQSRARGDDGPVPRRYTVTRRSVPRPNATGSRRRLRELVKRLDAVSMRPHK